ncbi:MAG: hypothetical protein HY911_15180 [Desulfobacterales bacterium]|nr:hypothetical protein [Desulfobacterales bacterium]
MKNFRNGWLAMVSLLCFALVLNCGGSSSTALTPDDPELSSQDLFYATISETTPVYTLLDATAVRAAAPPRGLPAEWGSEAGPLYSIFFTLREFQSPRDEGVVDRSNLYKLLYDAESVLMSGYESAEELPEPIQIPSPFAGIDTSETLFTRAANIEDDALSIAYSDSDERLEALITWKWTEEQNPDKAERGIAYYVLDKATQNVSIDMVYSVDYDISSPESTYNLRCKASGNAAAHSFEFSYLIGTTAIIAKGVSQGADNYVIFKFSTGGGDAYYLKVAAEAGEAFFKDVYEGSEAAPVTDPSGIDDEQGYLDWIEAQAFMTESDLLTSTVDLNVGDDDYAGLIDLVF